MDFVANSPTQIEEMLQKIGIGSIDELFVAIPKQLKLSSPKIDDGLSEFEGMELMKSIAAKSTFLDYESYLGAGAYEHHVPAIVSAICSKSEFLTAYTPYQAEASQGMLQSIYEYQSAICALTGMDVSNACVYDGASACAEALLMALRHHKNRKKILISNTLNPLYRGVVDQYLLNQDVNLVTVDKDQLMESLDEDIAAVLVQYPNFLGIMDEMQVISEETKKVSALFIICSNLLANALYAPPSAFGADIAVGDCQPFGIPLQFGGPYAGYMACRQELVRQLPGRIVGETTDRNGKRGFVLTLQAREQHIRRGKATSNICTNQALAALASLIGMLWYGKEGTRELALTNFRRAAYLKSQLQKVSGVALLDDCPSFNEFAVKFSRPVDEVLAHFRQHKIEPGFPLGQYYPHLEEYLLVAVTETKNREQLDRYVEVANNL